LLRVMGSAGLLGSLAGISSGSRGEYRLVSFSRPPERAAVGQLNRLHAYVPAAIRWTVLVPMPNCLAITP
jgi:hypothetical protein